MRSALTGILPTNLDYQRLALRVLPLLFATSAACASTENPQPVLVINGGAAGVGGEASGGTAGSSGGAGAQGGSGATGGSMGGSGAGAGTDAGGSAGMATGGAAGVGGSAGTTGGSGAMGGSAGTGAAGSGAGGAGGTGAMGGSAGSTSGGSGGTGTVNLYFSEYMEDGQNKGVEIYNAGPALNISQCVLRVYFNGSTTPNPDIPLDSKTLATGQVHTVCGSATAAGGVCQQIASNKLNPSGNDAVELACNGVTLDLIGKIGMDPGSGWSGGGISTNDQTLWRKCSVTSGNPNGFTDPSIEWQAPTGGAGLDYSNFGQTSCP